MLNTAHWNFNVAAGWVLVSSFSGFFALQLFPIQLEPVQYVALILVGICGVSSLAALSVLLVLMFRPLKDQVSRVQGARRNETSPSKGACKY